MVEFYPSAEAEGNFDFHSVHSHAPWVRYMEAARLIYVLHINQNASGEESVRHRAAPDALSRAPVTPSPLLLRSNSPSRRHSTKVNLRCRIVSP